ncbi:2-C-methyl-D-erythritol 4-phosphate cytidylyltransferase [Bacillus pakistanensis]|uniref:2-C-methyl-D-erythritol 4-phosphate cytidylyltransferase n=1 Tax=Rossellomorea pakistanensis TaxID=992288 RepID=A0ABS2NKD6_9BACI|nr:2-C-methyl-D-erythritol 4-phosphate cytidylyltransferase [Bacillus pakistanensis]MBM7588331.1 2-C-methyl-D-erythritol 4-phosphate cytidylyltransferase [Bacillus pakistanensis]
MNYQVIIPAAGKGKRMRAGKNKLLLQLEDRPVIVHTLQVFEADQDCKQIILSIHPDDKEAFSNLVKDFGLTKVAPFVMGGKERQDSVYNALKTIDEEGIVLVHDGARPFIKKEHIDSLVNRVNIDGAAIAAVPVKDTIKKAANGFVQETVERSSLWMVQTPQAFRVSLLEKAHSKAASDQYFGTDDASLVERLGVKVAVVESDYDNIKLTTPEDLYFAKAIIEKSRKGV